MDEAKHTKKTKDNQKYSLHVDRGNCCRNVIENVEFFVQFLENNVSFIVAEH